MAVLAADMNDEIFEALADTPAKPVRIHRGEEERVVMTKYFSDETTEREFWRWRPVMVSKRSLTVLPQSSVGGCRVTRSRARV